MKLPPYIVRRLLVAPLVLIVAVLSLSTLPLWLIAAAFMSRYVPGRWRVLRVAWFLFVYVFLEAFSLIVLFVLWVASGFGWKIRSPRFTEIHYRFMAWWLRRVMGTARRTFRITIGVEAPTTMGSPDCPLLVFCRHAGPGDSLLLINGLINGPQQRRPRIVLKDLLQFDPCVDVLLNRLPNRFVPSTGRAGQGAIDAIEELTSTMSASDAFVIFPEGGNFTEKRRERAIEKLDEIGRPKLADRAREMDNLLPPKPAGALAALGAAPTADVAFIGHVGLEELSTVSDIWRGIPMDAAVVATSWVWTADTIPEEAERVPWLYDQWQRIDDWIEGVFQPETPRDPE